LTIRELSCKLCVLAFVTLIYVSALFAESVPIRYRLDLG